MNEQSFIRCILLELIMYLLAIETCNNMRHLYQGKDVIIFLYTLKYLLFIPFTHKTNFKKLCYTSDCMVALHVEF